MADEFLSVVKGLWDSWEDAALVANKQTGQYLDTSKLHVLDHDGSYYRVKGPLNTRRPPQGYPVIIQAGASDTGRDFAAKVAEVVFAVQQDLETAKAFRKDMRSRAEGFGRDPNSVKILPGVSPIVATRRKRRRRSLKSSASSPIRLRRCVFFQSASVTICQAIPGRASSDFPAIHKDAGTFGQPGRVMAKEYKMTLRQLRDYAMAAQGHRLIWGTPERIADELQGWFEAEAADGFVIMPADFPRALDAFVDRVIPILQQRGIFRTDYEIDDASRPPRSFASSSRGGGGVRCPP